MRSILNIAIDTETLSVRPTAVITQISAKTFTFDDADSKWDINDRKYTANINIVPSLISGNFDIDKSTIEWWKKQTNEAKEQFNVPAVSLKEALIGLNNFINNNCNLHQADERHIWMQGTDFDGSVLRNAYFETFPDEEEHMIPWYFHELRDSRTCIMEWYDLIHPDDEANDPYARIPEMKPEEWAGDMLNLAGEVNTHNAMYDCDWLIHNMKYIHNSMKQIILNATANK